MPQAVPPWKEERQQWRTQEDKTPGLRAVCTRSTIGRNRMAPTDSDNSEQLARAQGDEEMHDARIPAFVNGGLSPTAREGTLPSLSYGLKGCTGAGTISPVSLRAVSVSEVLGYASLPFCGRMFGSGR